jgi:uncharacterized damage-inducible protein DinB
VTAAVRRDEASERIRPERRAEMDTLFLPVGQAHAAHLAGRRRTGYVAGIRVLFGIVTREARMAETKVEPRTMPSQKEQFLELYEREHATTMRVLRAYPPAELELRPHPKLKTARELAWVFVLESMLGGMGFRNEFADGVPAGEPPPAPDSWDELLAQLEHAHREFGDLVRATPDEELLATVRFFVAPGTMGDVTRLAWLWFLLGDQIHHRGQFSIYLRMAGGRVPSIYGPTADEPWT